MVKEKKAPSFLMNVITIIFAQIAVKLLGFVYRMVITNIDGFGDMGNGYYNFGYQIYTLLLAISSIGIPNAISKLVSERCALDDFRGAMRIFRVALVLFLCVGGFFAVAMFFGAEFIATTILDAPLAVYTIKVLSPALIFVSVSSVIRGFFAGQQNMKATNTSQVLEQFLKSLSTILIVLAMVGSKPEYMAAGATLATTISTFLSLCYLFIFYSANKKTLKEKVKKAPAVKIEGNFGKIAKMILAVSIPISLGAIVASLNRVVDIVTVVRGVKIALADKFPDVVTLGDEAVRLSGILSKTDVLVNLPLAINTAFSTVLVPTVAGALAVKNFDTAREKISFSLLISIIIALPCSIGYMVLSGPILKLIYPNASEGALIFTLVAPTVFFSAMSQTIYGALQGMGKIYVPALSVLLGGIVKVICNLVLIPIPAINIYGAPIGSIFCQAIAFFVSFSVLRKNLDVRLPFGRYFARPFAAAICMAVAVWGIYTLSSGLGNTAATFISIVSGSAVYLGLIAAFKVFSRDEIRQIPFVKKFMK
ncbi:MAG: polysaccharide biosynthesis protein [Clostridia bacterium]|nr:polysaccharide biosynthesis protein [Clostridia bacterium]